MAAEQRDYRLYNERGEEVAKVPLPSPEPGIVVWKGLYFHLQAGRYVAATVWHHVG